MIDKKGRRVADGLGARARQSGLLQGKGSDHPSAKAVSAGTQQRQLAMLDPKTMKYTFVDTCFDTHHLQFGFDENDTLWTSGGGPVVGWLNTKMFDETGDAAKAQGWTALVLDTNGNGKRDDYVEPDQPVDPTKDKRIRRSGFYAVMPSPVDGSVWGTVACSAARAAVVRLDPGLESAEHRARRDLQRAQRPASACAAPTSTPRASSGCRSAAAISAASTGASARVR